MQLSRNFTNKIWFILDQIIPPILRDSKWFMYLPMKLFFGDSMSSAINYKKNMHTKTDDEINLLYKTVKTPLNRPTDNNKETIENILSSILETSESLLDVGAGRGYLVKKLKQKYPEKTIYASDIIFSDSLLSEKNDIQFIESNIYSLPFKENSIDTIICTHVLEHILDFQKAVNELRRIAKQQLIIVVPKQRPYLYTFDLHVQFFPYKHSFLNALPHLPESNISKSCYIDTIKGDIFYMEIYE